MENKIETESNNQNLFTWPKDPLAGPDDMEDDDESGSDDESEDEPCEEPSAQFRRNKWGKLVKINVEKERHPDCKYSREELKEMSMNLIRRRRSRFVNSVYYSGKNPEELMAYLLTQAADDDLDQMLYTLPTRALKKELRRVAREGGDVDAFMNKTLFDQAFQVELLRKHLRIDNDSVFFTQFLLNPPNQDKQSTPNSEPPSGESITLREWFCRFLSEGMTVNEAIGRVVGVIDEHDPCRKTSKSLDLPWSEKNRGNYHRKFLNLSEIQRRDYTILRKEGWAHEKALARTLVRWGLATCDVYIHPGNSPNVGTLLQNPEAQSRLLQRHIGEVCRKFILSQFPPVPLTDELRPTNKSSIDNKGATSADGEISRTITEWFSCFIKDGMTVNEAIGRVRGLMDESNPNYVSPCSSKNVVAKKFEKLTQRQKMDYDLWKELGLDHNEALLKTMVRWGIVHRDVYVQDAAKDNLRGRQRFQMKKKKEKLQIPKQLRKQVTYMKNMGYTAREAVNALSGTTSGQAPQQTNRPNTSKQSGRMNVGRRKNNKKSKKSLAFEDSPSTSYGANRNVPLFGEPSNFGNGGAHRAAFPRGEPGAANVRAHSNYPVGGESSFRPNSSAPRVSDNYGSSMHGHPFGQMNNTAPYRDFSRSHNSDRRNYRDHPAHNEPEPPPSSRFDRFSHPVQSSFHQSEMRAPFENQAQDQYYRQFNSQQQFPSSGEHSQRGSYSSSSSRSHPWPSQY